MNMSILEDALALLRDMTPLRSDCGVLCGAACCSVDEDGQGGVYLFPNEIESAKNAPWARVVEDEFAPMLVCEGACDRDVRPFACRMFPLTPRRKKDGSYKVGMDCRAFAICPLATSGVRGLNPAFVDAAIAAINLISTDDEGKSFIERWIALERSYSEPIF